MFVSIVCRVYFYRYSNEIFLISRARLCVCVYVCVIDLDGIRGTREQHNERDVRSNLFVTIKRKVYGTPTERLDASRDSKDRRYVIGKLETQFSCFENEMFLEGNTMSAILTGSTEYKSRTIRL